MTDIINSHIYTSYSKTIIDCCCFLSLSLFLSLSVSILISLSVFSLILAFLLLCFGGCLLLSLSCLSCFPFPVLLSHLFLSISVSVSLTCSLTPLILSPLQQHRPSTQRSPAQSPHYSFQCQILTRSSSFSQSIFFCCRQTQRRRDYRGVSAPPRPLLYHPRTDEFWIQPWSLLPREG